MNKAILASFEANAALIDRQEIFLETYDFYAELDKKFPVTVTSTQVPTIALRTRRPNE